MPPSTAAPELDRASAYATFEERALHGLDLRAGGQLCAANADRLLDYVRGLDLARFLRTFSDEDIARMMQPRAYWHPGGFIRSQLLRGSRDLPEVRLHHWKSGDGAARFDEAVHEHPWDSVSIVLRGAVRNEFWRIGEGGDCPIVYFETQDAASAAYNRIGTCTPQLTAGFDVAQGRYYWIPSGVFHRTRLLSDQAVTLFVRGPFLRKFSLIADRTGPAQYSSVTTEVGLGELAELAATLRRFTGAGGFETLAESGPDPVAVRA